MGKNLTGNKRILYDSGVALYNAIQKWKSLTAESHSVILNIWNEKLEEINAQDLTNKAESISGFPSEIFKQQEILIFSLINKLKSLELTIQKMKNSVTQIMAVSELSDLQSNNTNAAAQEITSMFEDELKVKTSVSKEICHISDKTAFLFFEACWKYEAKIDKYKLDKLLNGILFELDLILEIN